MPQAAFAGRWQGLVALRDLDLVYVGLGSDSDVGARSRNVCFAPMSRLVGAVGYVEKCQFQTLEHYSITSSARERRSSETFRPRALAVFRLITNSNLVGCKTGSSAGFAPFRTLPV